jgi:type VI protein secretion system component VasF
VLSHEKEVRSQLNQQQQQLDAGRSDLEKQRQVIAQQRAREPLIAAAVQSVGLWLACTTPLVLALYVLRLMFAQSPEHAAVAELLVSELTTEQPKLLPAPVFSPARLVHQPSPEQPGSGDPSPHD